LLHELIAWRARLRHELNVAHDRGQWISQIVHHQRGKLTSALLGSLERRVDSQELGVLLTPGD
jgi:hypothetical protein